MRDRKDARSPTSLISFTYIGEKGLLSHSKAVLQVTDFINEYASQEAKRPRRRRDGPPIYKCAKISTSVRAPRGIAGINFPMQ